MTDFKDHVFHYTSAGALLQIVTGRQLWATDTAWLNDRLEGTLVNRVLQKMADDQSGVYFPETFPPKHREALGISLRTGRLCVTTSFSRQWNSLPQFRMYSPAAGGYAIGFPIDYLRRVAQLIECKYSESELLTWCHSFALEFLDSVAEIDDDAKTAAVLSNEIHQTTDLFRRRVIAGLTFKSGEFVNETELRLCKFTQARKFRESPDRNLIIPFDVLELPNDPITVGLVAGPNREQALAQQSLYHAMAAAKEAGTKWQLTHMGTGEFGFRA